MVPIVDMQKIDYYSLSGMDIYNLVRALISYVLARIAVPCFFMFSGFLFFYKIREWNNNLYLDKVKSRFKTLIIPYILWNLILVFIHAALNLVKMDGNSWLFFSDLYDNGLWKIFWNYNEWGSTNTNLLGWTIPSYGPYLLSLWFLRDLIVMVFLSPLIYYWIKYTKLYGIVLFGILYYTKIGFVIPGYGTGEFLSALFFFSFGAYFSIFGKNMVVSLRKGQLFCLLLAIVSLILSTYYCGSGMEHYFVSIYVFSGVVTAVNITSYFMERGKLKVSDTLSKASFFIYIIHGILLDWLRRSFDKIFHPESAVFLLILYLIVPFICVFICLGIYCLMRKFTPKLQRVLTGNR